MKNITENLIEYFEETETTKEYYGYVYNLIDSIIITILGTFCGLKSLKQIHQWATEERTREFLWENAKISEIPCY